MIALPRITPITLVTNHPKKQTRHLPTQPPIHFPPKLSQLPVVANNHNSAPGRALAHCHQSKSSTSSLEDDTCVQFGDAPTDDQHIATKPYSARRTDSQFHVCSDLGRVDYCAGRNSAWILRAAELSSSRSDFSTAYKLRIIRYISCYISYYKITMKMN